MMKSIATIIAGLLLGQSPVSATGTAATVPLMASGASSKATFTPGPSYALWLAQGDNAERVAEFESELHSRNLYGIVPTEQMLRTAMSWEQCGASEFELPIKSDWNGAFTSLSVIRDELVPRIGRVELVSGYRNPALNSCAGGAKHSVHRQFGAFDAYAVDMPTREAMIDELCSWHRIQGQRLAAGLGIYSGKKFHIDAGLKGYRTWGSNYRRASSPCI